MSSDNIPCANGEDRGSDLRVLPVAEYAGERRDAARAGPAALRHVATVCVAVQVDTARTAEQGAQRGCLEEQH